MLRFHGELGRLSFAELIPLPQLLEQVKAEIPAQRLFDHLTIAFARPGGTDLHPAQNVLVDREGGPHFCHKGIIASMRQGRYRIAAVMPTGSMSITAPYAIAALDVPGTTPKPRSSPDEHELPISGYDGLKEKEIADQLAQLAQAANSSPPARAARCRTDLRARPGSPLHPMVTTQTSQSSGSSAGMSSGAGAAGASKNVATKTVGAPVGL
jgi:hypothetical protein